MKFCGGKDRGDHFAVRDLVSYGALLIMGFRISRFDRRATMCATATYLFSLIREGPDVVNYRVVKALGCFFGDHAFVAVLSGKQLFKLHHKKFQKGCLFLG